MYSAVSNSWENYHMVGEHIHIADLLFSNIINVGNFC
jgi:hypothetical protein